MYRNVDKEHRVLGIQVCMVLSVRQKIQVGLSSAKPAGLRVSTLLCENQPFTEIRLNNVTNNNKNLSPTCVCRCHT